MSNQNVTITWEPVGIGTRYEAFVVVATPVENPRQESAWEFNTEEEAEDFVIQFRQTPGVTVVEEFKA